MNKKSIPFYLIIISLFIGIVSPALFSDGMFMDGLLYSTISKNLSNHIGSFWDLHLTETFAPHFTGHPPLAFGLQSLFFEVLGDSLYTERIYSLLTFFITGWIIVLIWKKITKDDYQTIAWLPLLFWISIPLVSWAAANNMLENTMMIFTSLSVLFILKSFDNYRILYLTASGIMLFLGFLTKGFVALFPLSMLFWIWLFNRNIKFIRLIIDSFLLIVAAILPLLVIWLIVPEGIESIKAYIDEQVVGSINNAQTVSNRFFILGQLVQQIIPGLIIMILIYFISRIKTYNEKNVIKNSNWKYVFLALAISGVLPIMISMKQRGFYILASFPLFAVVLALFAAPSILILLRNISYQSKGIRIFKRISYALILISIVISSFQINRIGRDKELLTDVYKMIEIMPPDSTIGIHPNLYSKWELHGYFGRYANISLDSDTKNDHNYFLVLKNIDFIEKDNFQKIRVDLNMFELYSRKL